jgi:heme O synthase-like polyprenyltransferase
MGKKVALNVLYNIGIMIALFFVYIGITHGHFWYIAIAVFVGTLFVFLKIRILKDVKAMQRPVPQPPVVSNKKKSKKA